MSSASAAAKYVQGGVCVVPVPAGEKNPKRSGWQELRITLDEIPSYFPIGQNIGIHNGEPSQWLVAGDLDCPEAQAIAGRFFLPTLTSGRESTPDSHWWFYSVGAEHRVFKDLDGSMILELRSTGHHTLVSPSVHPSGEQYRWSESGLEASTVDAGELLEACRKLASAALIARHLMPLKDQHTGAGGGRHDYALAVAGFMLRRIGEGDVLAILRAAWDARGFGGNQLAQKEAHKDLSGLVRDTARRIEAGDRATGGKTLDELVQGLPRKLADYWDWSGSTADNEDGVVGRASGAGDGPSPGYEHTDLGNGDRFVDRHGESVRWCSAAKSWLVWDGVRWSWDDFGTVRRLAHDTARSIHADAASEPDRSRQREIVKWAISSQSQARINGMLDAAWPYLTVRMDDLDTDPWVINCKNGALDLRTAALRDHDPADLITKLAPVSYDPDAECPVFKEYLRTTLVESDLIAFVRRFAGYTMTGDTSERCLAILHGSGKNGKSTLVELLQDALGDYAANTSVETILSQKHAGVGNDVAALKGPRFVSCAEIGQNRRLDESKVKQLTGRDTVTARFLFGEPFNFRPAFTLWLSTNHKPVIHGTDDAIWDRIKLVPFEQRFDQAADPRLPDKLRDELPGVFAWIVSGCLDWQRHGLGEPDTVAEATQEYRTEMDTLAAFIEERCIVAENTSVPASVLYKEYQDWCESAGERIESQKAFGTRLRERGFESVKITSGAYKRNKGWVGIGLSHDPDGPPEEDNRPPDGPPKEADVFGNKDMPSVEGSPGAGMEDDCPPTENSVYMVNVPDSATRGDEGGSSSVFSGVKTPSREKNMEIRSPSSPSPDRVEAVFRKPPSWLTNQVAVYQRSPSESEEGREKRLVKPVAAAIASHLELDAGEIHDQVDRELGKWLVRKARREDDPEASR